MDNFYKYKVSYYNGLDEVETDSGIVYAPTGNLNEAVEEICLDYVGDCFEDIVSVSVSRIYEEGKFTLSRETMISFLKEEGYYG